MRTLIPNKARGTALIASAVVTLMCLALPASVFAADNTATGDIGGVSADLINSLTFTLNSDTLSIVKTAFLAADSSELSTGTNLPSGTEVHFLLYIDNPTAVAVNDINMSDPLTGFTYVGSSIRVDNSEATGATAAAIFAAAISGTPTDDPTAPGNVAGISGTTVSAGSATSNDQLDIAASAVWAMVFTVTLD